MKYFLQYQRGCNVWEWWGGALQLLESVKCKGQGGRAHLPFTCRLSPWDLCFPPSWQRPGQGTLGVPTPRRVRPRTGWGRGGRKKASLQERNQGTLRQPRRMEKSAQTQWRLKLCLLKGSDLRRRERPQGGEVPGEGGNHSQEFGIDISNVRNRIPP